MIGQSHTVGHHGVGQLLDRLSAELVHAARAARRLDDMASGQLARAPQSELQELDALTQHLEQLSAFVTNLSAVARDGGAIDLHALEQAASSVSLSALAARLVGQTVDTEPVSSGDCEVW